MKIFSKCKKIIAIALSVLSVSSFAGTVEVGPVYLDSVTVIGSSAFGHAAGNLEIKITNGMGNPAGVSCDSNYVTTKNTVQNYKEMLSMLIAAQVAQKPVRLGITEESSLVAFTNRCSLVSVTILK